MVPYAHVFGDLVRKSPHSYKFPLGKKRFCLESGVLRQAKINISFFLYIAYVEIYIKVHLDWVFARGITVNYFPDHYMLLFRLRNFVCGTIVSRVRFNNTHTHTQLLCQRYMPGVRKERYLGYSLLHILPTN